MVQFSEEKLAKVKELIGSNKRILASREAKKAQ